MRPIEKNEAWTRDQHHVPSNWWVHLLLDLVVCQFKVGNPLHCAAFVGKLGQAGQLALAGNKHEV
jgi:hypothetical protein